MLRDGSRVTITGNGYTSLPTLTIRFYTLRNIPLQQLTHAPYRMMSPLILTLLQAILTARYNLVLIGQTNTGKTNLLKALIAELPSSERLVTIEGRYEMMISIRIATSLNMKLMKMIIYIAPGKRSSLHCVSLHSASFMLRFEMTMRISM